ncbi:MAG: hypothetical protein WC423_24805, partial [Vulcanimicrobiota bacterium]
TAQVQQELEAYQTELNREVAAKLAAKQQELGLAAPRPSQPQQPSGPPPEVTQKIAEIESRMRAQLQSRQAELKTRMEAKVADSRIRLETKQKEITASLDKVSEEIQKRISEQLAKLPEEMSGEIKEVDEQIKKLQEESEKLYGSIRTDIDSQVAGIAKDKNEEMVIGAYRYVDPSFQDLTDLSQVRVQQMENKS